MWHYIKGAAKIWGIIALVITGMVLFTIFSKDAPDTKDNSIGKMVEKTENGAEETKNKLGAEAEMKNFLVIVNTVEEKDELGGVKTDKKYVVPVECCAEQGTAFFINKRQLMTARHVVREHFSDPASPEPIYIKLGGDSMLCSAVDLKGNADIALLTIDNAVNYNAPEWLPLLKDEFVKDLELRAYGYPQEVAMGVNLVDLYGCIRLGKNPLGKRHSCKRLL